MSARIVLTDVDGDRHIQEYQSSKYARQAMHFMSGVIGRALRTEKPQILGIGEQRPNQEAFPEFSIRTDFVKSLRLVEDEEDEEEATPDREDGDTKLDPDWWKK